MDDAELAETLNIPVGLKNLGNTSYVNATVQAMRAIPELQTALKDYVSGTDPQSSLTGAMRDLYEAMGKTTEGFPPYMFLQFLRQAVPQFNEQSREGVGPAQQDAEEYWTQVVNSLSVLPGVVLPGGSNQKCFVEQFMTGEMITELKCIEAPEEEPTILKEKITKVSCYISKETNCMYTGMTSSWDQTIEKHSSTLGREAQYTQHSRISRLPSNLMVHMVRLHWRRDINKKAKIMRRVKFPFELDAIDMVADDLKQKLANANSKVKEVERERAERRKVRKKTNVHADSLVPVSTNRSGSLSATAAGEAPSDDVPVADVHEGSKGQEQAKELVAGDLEDEAELRERENKGFGASIDPELRADTGASVTGLFELCAIVAHKEGSADSDHYIGFVKKDVFRPAKSYLEEYNQDWYQFDDEKVSVMAQEKVSMLDGGGESASAYMLLYRQKRL